MAPSLGILLADRTLIGVAVELARAGQGAEHAALFLMDDGVRAASDPRLGALLDEGAEIAVCAMDAEARGLSPVDGGPRFGSQYDHAVMIRDAARIVALTGTRIDDTRPVTSPRRVAVRITQDARHPKSAQALRSAAGYAAVDLQVTVVIEPAARGLLAHTDHDAQVLRAITTLRGLGHTLVGAAPGHAPAGPLPDVVITW
jgi:hypothetical protein